MPGDYPACFAAEKATPPRPAVRFLFWEHADRHEGLIPEWQFHLIKGLFLLEVPPPFLSIYISEWLLKSDLPEVFSFTVKGREVGRITPSLVTGPLNGWECLRFCSPAQKCVHMCPGLKEILLGSWESRIDIWTLWCVKDSWGRLWYRPGSPALLPVRAWRVGRLVYIVMTDSSCVAETNTSL